MSSEISLMETSESKDERVLKSELKRTKDLQKKRLNTFSDIDDYNFDPNDFEIPACKKLCYDDDDDDNDDDDDHPTEFETPSRKKLCYDDDDDEDEDSNNNNNNENNSSIHDSTSFGKIIQGGEVKEKKTLQTQTFTGISDSPTIKRVTFSLKNVSINNNSSSSNISATAEKPIKTTRLPLKTPSNDITLAANTTRNAWYSEPTTRVTEPIKATVFVKREPPKQQNQHHTMMPPPPFPSSQQRQQQHQQQPPPPPTIKITPAGEKKSLYPVPDLSGFDDDDDFLLNPASNKSSATPQLVRDTYTQSTPLKCPGTPTRTPTISRCQRPPMTVGHPSMYRKGYGNNGANLMFSMANLEPLGLIGEGSFGKVFKVRSLKNNQFYALKESNKPIPYTFPNVVLPSCGYNGGGGGGGNSGNLFPPKPPLSDCAQSLEMPALSVSAPKKSQRLPASASAMLRSGSGCGGGSGDMFEFMPRGSGDNGSENGRCDGHNIGNIFASVQHRTRANKAKNTVYLPAAAATAATTTAAELLKKPLSQTIQKSSTGSASSSSIFGSIELPAKNTIKIPTNTTKPIDNDDGNADNDDGNDSGSSSSSSSNEDDNDTDFFLNESPLIRMGAGNGTITTTTTSNNSNNNNNNNNDTSNDNGSSFIGGRGGFFLGSEVERMMSIPYHPNILSIVQAWSESDRKIRILTELCEKSLMKYLEELWAKDKGLSEEQILSYAHDIFKGVHHLHSHKTMHLDLKPDNLLLCNGGKSVKVGDFGLAHRAGDKIAPSEGDNKYMAPELLDGIFGFPADIFSLGITLYEMSVPKIVIPGKGERWRALRNNDIDFSMWTHSEELKELIKWMLRADPKERPTAAELVSHKIFRKGRIVVNKPLH